MAGRVQAGLAVGFLFPEWCPLPHALEGRGIMSSYSRGRRELHAVRCLPWKSFGPIHSAELVIVV